MDTVVQVIVLLNVILSAHSQLIPCEPPCGPGTCVLGQCLCPDDFTGSYCETPRTCYNLCELGNICVGGATCLYNEVTGCVSCLCPSGYTGSRCQTEIPCLRDCGPGTCVGMILCICPISHTGATCETPIGCYPDCGNGRCVVLIGQCICQPDYTGTRCETEILPNEGYSCNSTRDNYACDPSRLEFGWFYYPYEGDSSMYVECVQDAHEVCNERHCPDGQLWDRPNETCKDTAQSTMDD